MERRFWRTSGLGRYREDDADDVVANLTPLQLSRLEHAIYELDATPYSDAIYDAAEVLVEAGWDNARQLLDLSTGFDVVPERAPAALRGEVKRFAFLVVQREKDALSGVLDAGLRNGDSAAQVARSIQAAFADGFHVDPDGELLRTTGKGRVIAADVWSKMVARTELSRASNRGAMELYTAAGIEKVRWSAANGGNCCEECSDDDDEVVAIGDSFPYVDVDSPPAHPNCSPAGTLIATARGLLPIEDVRVGDLVVTHRNRLRMVRALSRTEVSEDLVELRVGAHILRVTGNHPVYTGDRWTAAATLKPGDQVCAVQSEAMLGAASEPNEIPSLLAQETFLGGILGSLSFGPGMPPATVELDRELSVRQSDVDTADVERVVRDRREAGFPKRLEDDRLVRGFVPGLLGQGALAEFGLRPFPATKGGMGGIRVREPLLGAELRVPHELRSRTAAPGEPESQEAVGDRIAGVAIAERKRDREDTLAGDVASVESEDRLVAEPASHIVIVGLDHAHRVAHRGAVFNFAVDEDESYVANGVVVHNCVCGIVSADDFDGRDDASQADRDRASRGGYSADEYEAKFGQRHPIDDEDD